MPIDSKLKEVHDPRVPRAFEVTRNSGDVVGPLKEYSPGFANILGDLLGNDGTENDPMSGTLDVELIQLPDGYCRARGTSPKPFEGMLKILDSEAPKTKILSR